jgi:hypothetical protein
MENKLKEQATSLELGTMFVLCGNAALPMHIPNIAVFVRQDHRMEVSMGKFHICSAHWSRYDKAVRP